MTARQQPPKALKYRFFYPEFQNRIEKQLYKKAHTPNDQAILVPERLLPDFVRYCK